MWEEPLTAAERARILQPADVAAAALYAVTQPARALAGMIVLAPAQGEP